MACHWGPVVLGGVRAPKEKCGPCSAQAGWIKRGRSRLAKWVREPQEISYKARFNFN